VNFGICVAIPRRNDLVDIELVDNNYPTMLDGASLPDLLARYDLIDSSARCWCSADRVRRAATIFHRFR